MQKPDRNANAMLPVHHYEIPLCLILTAEKWGLLFIAKVVGWITLFDTHKALRRVLGTHRACHAYELYKYES